MLGADIEPRRCGVFVPRLELAFATVDFVGVIVFL